MNRILLRELWGSMKAIATVAETLNTLPDSGTADDSAKAQEELVAMLEPVGDAIVDELMRARNEEGL